MRVRALAPQTKRNEWRAIMVVANVSLPMTYDTHEPHSRVVLKGEWESEVGCVNVEEAATIHRYN